MAYKYVYANILELNHMTGFFPLSLSLDMEDAHVHILSLPDDKNCAFFAVYDGHGG